MIQAVKAAEQLASGQVRFHRNCDADEWLERQGRAVISPEHELFLWECFGELCKELSPKVKFSRDGVCNIAEKRRRNAMFGLFHLIEFRSEDLKIKEIFQRNFGQVSLAWMMGECGTKPAPFYYAWAFDAIKNVTGKTWGPTALALVENSWPHMEVFQKLAPEKFNQLAVKRVMES
jgi:hypothetical protein